MYKFHDLTPISGYFRTNFKISGQRPGLTIIQTDRQTETDRQTDIMPNNIEALHLKSNQTAMLTKVSALRTKA